MASGKYIGFEISFLIFSLFAAIPPEIVIEYTGAGVSMDSHLQILLNPSKER